MDNIVFRISFVSLLEYAFLIYAFLYLAQMLILCCILFVLICPNNKKFKWIKSGRGSHFCISERPIKQSSNVLLRNTEIIRAEHPLYWYHINSRMFNEIFSHNNCDKICVKNSLYLRLFNVPSIAEDQQLLNLRGAIKYISNFFQTFYSIKIFLTQIYLSHFST